MAKLTLSDILGGYQTAVAYNANNALIEAAFENTLSRDGTTPNTMGADIDMNSNDLTNASNISASGQVSAATFMLNGQAVSLSTTLTGGLDATEVTFTPTNPAGPATTLQDAFDDDYMRNDRNESLTGTFDVSGLLTAADALTVTTGNATVSAGDVILSAGDVDVTGDIIVSGSVDGVDIAALELSTAPSVVTNHTRAGIMQIVNYGAGFNTSGSIHSNITKDTFESVGPTGSGADWELSIMDDLPSNAAIWIVSIEAFGSSSGASSMSITMYACDGDIVSPNTSNAPELFQHSWDPDAASEGYQTTGLFYIPLNSNQVCQLRWTDINATTTNLNIRHRGFLTDG